MERVHSRVQEALDGYLEEGEIAVNWGVVIDVATPDGGRYLIQRFGGGHDGGEPPTTWAALGMLQAAADGAREELREGTRDYDDEDEDDNDE